MKEMFELKPASLPSTVRGSIELLFLELETGAATGLPGGSKSARREILMAARRQEPGVLFTDSLWRESRAESGIAVLLLLTEAGVAPSGHSTSGGAEAGVLTSVGDVTPAPC